MTKVIADISMSVDGFVTGPDAGPDNGLGTGGEPLHTWVFENHEVDRAALQRSMDDSGAVVMGRRLFDIIDDPRGWSDDMGYGADLAGRPPFFVVTHRPPVHVRLALDFTFCAGIGDAIDQARGAAGGKAVIVMGGGQVIAQCLQAGLVDELRLHIAPIVLGAGTPLFESAGRWELVQRSVEVSPHATHLTYDVVR
jgi:dihydrofolate reductase